MIIVEDEVDEEVVVDEVEEEVVVDDVEVDIIESPKDTVEIAEI